MAKTYVSIDVLFGEDGTMAPQTVIWRDGSRYEVDRVLDVRPAASMKAGGAGIRYTCRICGKIKYLFFEVSRWFVYEGE
ncbi:MAG: hypothetical protein RSE36_04990 [Oscillospiraceae bacterium]